MNKESTEQIFFFTFRIARVNGTLSILPGWPGSYCSGNNTKSPGVLRKANCQNWQFVEARL